MVEQHGWVKSTDPRTGRTYYANRITRKTQWNPPPGWVDDFGDDGVGMGNGNGNIDDLPANWERMQDPKTGRYFYVDHVNKVTTWTHPGGGNRGSSKGNLGQGRQGWGIIGNDVKSNNNNIVNKINNYNGRNHNNYPTKSTSQSSYKQQYQIYQSQPVQPRELNDSASYHEVLPPLDYAVKPVDDQLRSSCPGCGQVFSLALRRHHCRSCGDLWCHACTAQKTLLPLDGPEYASPVRVCKVCHADIEAGNYFSLRRVLAPLQVDMGSDQRSAALSSLNNELDEVLRDASRFHEKITLPADVLVPAVARHLKDDDRAIRALSTLLALGKISGDDSFVKVVYDPNYKVSEGDNPQDEATTIFTNNNAGGVNRSPIAQYDFLADILHLLERSGSSKRTLFVQEQAARAIFYLSDKDNGGTSGLDIPRTVSIVLDHATSSASPSLQRWATATLCHLLEVGPDVNIDLARATLVEDGGIIILCSLLTAEDADTRAHAVAALSSLLAHEQNEQQLEQQVQSRPNMVLESICNGGGCGPAVSQLLLSSDRHVAQRTADYCARLLAPWLNAANMNGNAVKGADTLFTAAMALAQDSTRALIQLAHGGGGSDSDSSIELRLRAMQTLACMTVASNSAGSPLPEGILSALPVAYEILSGTRSIVATRDSPQSQLREAAGLYLSQVLQHKTTASDNDSVMEGVVNFLVERKATIVLFTLAGDDGMHLPSGLIRDAPRCLVFVQAAAALLTAVWYRGQTIMLEERQRVATNGNIHNANGNGCLNNTIVNIGTGNGIPNVPVSTDINTNAINAPTIASTEIGLDASTVDHLLEAIDAGAVPVLTHVIQEGTQLATTAACRALAAMYGIAHGDQTHMGTARLYDAQPHRAMSHIVSPDIWQAHQSPSLVAEALMALGSACGQCIGAKALLPEDLPVLFEEKESVPQVSNETTVNHSNGRNYNQTHNPSHNSNDVNHYRNQKEQMCKTAIMNSSLINALPSMLVGAYGEESVGPALRLALAMAQFGPKDMRPRLAPCLVPLYDMLRVALMGGDRYNFTAVVVLVCSVGPYVTAESGDGILLSLRQAIKTLSSVLSVSEANYDGDVEISTLEFLKENCITTFESLSHNRALWAELASSTFAPICSYLKEHENWDDGVDAHRLCGALRTVQRLVALPSHASAAITAGMCAPLARLTCGQIDNTEDIDKSTYEGRRMALQRERTRRDKVPANDVKLLTLEVLHTLASHDRSPLLRSGVVGAACFALGGAASSHNESANTTASQSQNSTTVLGLELLYYVIVELSNPDINPQWAQDVKAFVEQVARQSRFIRALCATLLLLWDKQQKQGKRQNGATLSQLPPSIHSSPSIHTEISWPLYGPPLVSCNSPCAGHRDSDGAAVTILVAIASLCSIDTTEAQYGDAFWDTFLVKEDRSLVNARSKRETAVSACSVLLSILQNQHSSPLNKMLDRYYSDDVLPLVQERLLEGLFNNFQSVFDGNQSSNDDVDEPTEDDLSALRILKTFRIPSLCMTLCGTTSMLVEACYSLIQGLTSAFPDEILPNIMSDESSLRSALDMLNYHHDDSGDDEESSMAIRVLFVKIVCAAATRGYIGPSLDKFGLRSKAIAAISAACGQAKDTETPHYCLQSLVSIFNSSKQKMTSVEAAAIAHSLGATISNMVLDRYAVRVRSDSASVPGNNSSHPSILSNSEVCKDEMKAKNDSDADVHPEVSLLCNLASHREALTELCRVGGLEAICLVSSDGVPSAILAMHAVVVTDPNVILDVEGHTYVMDMLVGCASSNDYRRSVVAFDFLTTLCRTHSGLQAVSKAETCSACIQTASNIICSYENSIHGSIMNENGGANEATNENNVNYKQGPETAQGAEDNTKSKVDENQKDGSDGISKSATIAAISFLHILTRDETNRSHILEDSLMMSAFVSLGVKCHDISISVHAVQLLATIASSTTLKDNDYFNGIFSDILSRSDLRPASNNVVGPDLRQMFGKKSNKFSAIKKSDGTNLLVATVASGLEGSIDGLISLEIAEHFCRHIQRLIDDYIRLLFSRRSGPPSFPSSGGLLLYQVMNLLLMTKLSSTVEESKVDKISQTHELMMLSMQIVVIHEMIEEQFSSVDQPQTIKDEVLYLTAARTQCLQFISSNAVQDGIFFKQDTLAQVTATLTTKKEQIVGVVGLSLQNVKKSNTNKFDFVEVIDNIIEKRMDPLAAANAIKIKNRLC